MTIYKDSTLRFILIPLVAVLVFLSDYYDRMEMTQLHGFAFFSCFLSITISWHLIRKISRTMEHYWKWGAGPVNRLSIQFVVTGLGVLMVDKLMLLMQFSMPSELAFSFSEIQLVSYLISVNGIYLLYHYGVKSNNSVVIKEEFHLYETEEEKAVA
ncbi:hypothetical protein [Aureibacter tunicatorum]|uniref:Uncharacterized protein n=1 Tax=Aureibacter tunicatorum TaxID=866807 RepID=A0AAE4BT91_9BACT|nr:hypothetical protein [Aureibacter tunicatorum]MDR6239608.1 hypothetical protein [Aureibacter tunicatorum]BDD04085.1 hypothetical protein AUTU_15680 [Aureibacter tunicatorum]